METVRETLNPDGPGQQDEFTAWMRGGDAQFLGAKRLPDGTYAGVRPLLFTYAICMGVTRDLAYQKRFCYEDTTACLHAYSTLMSFNDEPEGWIARRPLMADK